MLNPLTSTTFLSRVKEIESGGGGGGGGGTASVRRGRWFL